MSVVCQWYGCNLKDEREKPREREWVNIQTDYTEYNFGMIKYNFVHLVK